MVFMTISLGYSQTLTHGSKVKLGTIPSETTSTNTVLVTDSAGIISDGGVDLGDLGGTGLEALNEGNGIGWRLVGRNPLNYGNIGLNAVDLSASTGASSVFGATGANNFAFGTDLQVQGDTNIVFGVDHVINAGTYSSTNTLLGFENLLEPWAFVTITNGYLNTTGTALSGGSGDPVAWHSGNFGYFNNLYGGRGSYMFGSALEGGSAFTTIVGAANVDLTSATANQNWSPSNTILNPAFIVGVGTIDSSTPAVPVPTRLNGFVVWRNGTAELPSGTITEIETRGDKSIITKEVLDSRIIKLTFTLTAGNLATLNTVPVEILAAPGAGLVYRLKNSGTGFLDYGTTTYDFGVDIEVEYSTSGINVATINITQVNDTNDNAFHLDKVGASGIEISPNEGIRVRAIADPSTGDGVLRGVLYYTIETTGF